MRPICPYCKQVLHLTEDDKRAILEELKAGTTIKELVELTGFTRQTIWRIKSKAGLHTNDT